ncbi:MAG TPA: hypothetical protein VL990_11985 [Acidobacteriaceae bacterium]|nr:hypothetical protein [Acidobacteriaceae bacterium]
MAPKVTARKRQVVLSGARPAASPNRPRPWKSSDAAAAARDFFARSPTTGQRRTAIRGLIGELCSGDSFDRRCAAEVARLISRREPGVLAGYGDLLAEVAATLPMEEWQARGYVLVAAAHNAVTGPQRRRLLPLVRARLDEDRIAVRAMALEAFAILAARTPELRDEALERLEAARHSGDFAMRARARLMLPVATGRAVQADAAQRAMRIQQNAAALQNPQRRAPSGSR